MQKRRYGMHCNIYGYVRMRITETAGTVSEANKTVYAVAGVASATPADISPSLSNRGAQLRWKLVQKPLKVL